MLHHQYLDPAHARPPASASSSTTSTTSTTAETSSTSTSTSTSTNRSCSNSLTHEHSLTDVERGSRPEIDRSEISFGPEVGRGKFGSVYRAKCRGQEVAIKVLNQSYVGAGMRGADINHGDVELELLEESHRRALADFRKEVAALSLLSHPHIVTYMGTCVDNNHLMIVQDFCPHSLEAFVADRGKAARRTATTLAKGKMLTGVARGMNWLHANNPPVLHLDLKPANILMDDTDCCKVADFGQARVLRSKTATTASDDVNDGDGAAGLFDGDEGNGAGELFGSPLYTAPEIFDGESPTTKSDVYSFAITAHELFSGIRAFPKAKGLFGLMREVREGHRPCWDEHSAARDVSGPVRTLIEDCWSTRPEDRPDFAIIVQHLEDALFELRIPDAQARRFWRENFTTLFGPEDSGAYVVSDSVSWEEFNTRVMDHFFADASETIPHEKDLAVAKGLLKKILRSESGQGGVSAAAWKVSVSAWGQLCEWFGPVLEDNHSVILKNVLDACSQKWFFGSISKDDANERCAKPGQFLVRFSGSTHGAFVITRAVKAADKKSFVHVHTTINRRQGNYVLMKTGEAATSLSKIISLAKKSLGLGVPPDGSEYASFVSDKRKETKSVDINNENAYEDVKSDED